MTENNQQSGFWTTMPGILTGIAGVLGGILAIIQVFKPSTPPPSPQVSQSLNSFIEVAAKSEQGTPFTNPQNKPVLIQFQAEGQWSIIPKNFSGDNWPRGFISPNGDGNFRANPDKLCPGFALGALVVRTQQGECIASGANGTFDLKSGETVYLSANDVKRLYEDNDGSVKIKLSIVD